MFARIAGRYDLLNRGLSLGVDRGWRARAVRRCGPVRGRIVVDTCTGTGDLAIAFARAGARVVGVDFTPQMLALAPGKRGASSVLFVQADALALPFAGGAADVCCVAFGIRNLADRRAGLGEMARVVRPGGTVLVLECSPPPRSALGALYRVYFTRVLPWIGGRVSGDAEAYAYLPRTVLEWPEARAYQREMEEAGLVGCGFERLTAGAACLHWGRVPERAPESARDGGPDGPPRAVGARA